MTDVLDDTAVEEPRPLSVFSKIYRGETKFDFVGHRRWWYTASGILILVGLLSLGTRGLNLGIDFKGGTSWTVPAKGITEADINHAMAADGVTPSVVQFLGLGASSQVEVQADLQHLSPAKQASTETAVSNSLATLAHIQVNKIDESDVGPTWGGDVTRKAIEAVIVFFIIVAIGISWYFEWKMAVAAILAVVHDLFVVAGIYSLSGLQVTPDTVVAVLTILGYSLYDTVVVFDRVKDNNRNFGTQSRMTYEDLVNLSMNQTLARSVNTSLVAILPVLSVLVVGAEILGATTLQYFGFALVIGLTSGAYSSIFIASPLLSQMKEREPRYITLRQKLEARNDRAGLLTPRAAAQLVSAPVTSNRRPSGSARSTGAAAKSAAAGRPNQAKSTTAAPIMRPGSKAGSARKSGPAITPAGSDALNPTDDEGEDSESPTADQASSAGSTSDAGPAKASPRPATTPRQRPPVKRGGAPNRSKGKRRR